MAKKPKLQADGKDFNPSTGKFEDVYLDINLPGKPANPGPVRGAGTPVTKAAFQEMQSRYFSRKQPNDTQYVTYGREAILSILAQYDCAGIKFYFVDRADTTTKQLTLTMVGVDENNNDLTSIATTGSAAASQEALTSEFGTGYPPTI